MDNLTLATCSYNTPEITTNMLKSYCFYHTEHPLFLSISENSSNDETLKILDSFNIKYSLNTNFHHARGVDFLIVNCRTKYLLLVDTDVIFLKNITDIYNQFKQSKSAICGVIQGSRGGMNLYDRICPWFCFIDVESIKNSSISYNQDRISLTPKQYDVGATFLEDIKKNNLGVMTISETVQNSYIKHFEGMSWRKYSNEAALKNMGISTEKQYQVYTSEAVFKDISLLNKFR